MDIKIDDIFKYFSFNLFFSDFMKLGGRCPLNYVKNQEEFLRTELQRFYKKQIDKMNIEDMKKEFCRNICDNIMC